MADAKRCSNCSFYPFCTSCENAISVCENWKKREIETEMKLESKDKENFKFRKI